MVDNVKPFELDEDDEKTSKPNSAVIKKGYAFDESRYVQNDRFEPATCIDEIHCTSELLEYAAKGEVEVDARIIAKEKGSDRIGIKNLDTKQFVEAFKNPDPINFTKPLRESYDAFSRDGFGSDAANLLGDDFVPLLSGPFYKQLYYHDYLRMHALAFQQYNHNPMARRLIHTLVEFTVGKGFKLDCEDQKHLIAWDIFEEANDFQAMFRDHIAKEYFLYGEQMLWWLPGNEKFISYHDAPGQESPKGIIPRIRQIDPSVIWEIVTFPEDIKRVLYYQWVAPTQYQIYSGKSDGKSVPSSKFIFQQIPAIDVQHFKQSVSNEKRGRSVLFPVFGDLKRLTDATNYSIAALQKNCAWSIDTLIKGNQNDINQYIADQQALGTIPPAGSEFVHSEAVERQYLSNSTAGTQQSDVFDWILSKIAMGLGIPVSYLGTHLTGGQTRASAVVGTEPAIKMFEFYQSQFEFMIKKVAREYFRRIGMNPYQEVEVTFPELITSDRTKKLKDLELAQSAGWLSKERVATMVAKELGITEYDYDQEKKKMEAEQPEGVDPFGQLVDEENPEGDPEKEGRGQVDREDVKDENR